MLVQHPLLWALHSSWYVRGQVVDLQEMRVPQVTEKFILIYPQTLILHDSVEAAAEARTECQRKFDMEVYRVEYAASLPGEKKEA